MLLGVLDNQPGAGARHRGLQRGRRACTRPTSPTTIQAGIAKARDAIESGAAKAKLEQLSACPNRSQPDEPCRTS